MSKFAEENFSESLKHTHHELPKALFGSHGSGMPDIDIGADTGRLRAIHGERPEATFGSASCQQSLLLDMVELRHAQRRPDTPLV